ncbi:MAG: HAD family hydrolase [Actinobacteria bacterium]|nr:HAD family hydrolase [Actinomycetota bacterium]
MAIEAVTFDFWNTLVRENPGLWDYRSRAWSALLAEQGHDVPLESLHEAFDTGWKHYVTAWNANVPFGAADALQVALGELGIDADARLADALLEVIIDPPADQHPSLNPNLVSTLAALRAADVRIGIICDVGLTPSPVLRRYLDAQGALEYFDHWSFSDEVGVYKPDATIFRHALDGLGGVAPERTAHVGDLRRTDIAGARGMGITAVRYTGVFDDPALPDSPAIEGDHVIGDHADLPVVLGIG